MFETLKGCLSSLPRCGGAGLQEGRTGGVWHFGSCCAFSEWRPCPKVLCYLKDRELWGKSRCE